MLQVKKKKVVYMEQKENCMRLTHKYLKLKRSSSVRGRIDHEKHRKYNNLILIYNKG